MMWLPLSSALKEITTRNAAITAAYRDWAKRLPPGPVSTLAYSMAEQRIDLGKGLRDLAGDQSIAGTRVEFDVDPASIAGVEPFHGRVIEPKELLMAMAEAETADHELLAALAGALLPASSEAAERLASEANSARKRAMWAQDHLDLLCMA
jgi:hypothetical protein